MAGNPLLKLSDDEFYAMVQQLPQPYTKAVKSELSRRERSATRVRDENATARATATAFEDDLIDSSEKAAAKTTTATTTPAVDDLPGSPLPALPTTVADDERAEPQALGPFSDNQAAGEHIGPAYVPDSPYTTARRPAPGARPLGSGPNGAYTERDVLRYGNLTPEAIFDMKARLVAAGYLDPEKLGTPGLWDTASANAAGNAMADSNVARVGVDMMLRSRAENPPEGGYWPDNGVKSRGQQLLEALNDDDVRAMANEIAPRTIGRRFDDAELAQFVASYRGMVGGGNPPTMEVAAEVYAEKAAPQEAEAARLLDVFNSFLSVAGGGTA